MTKDTVAKIEYDMLAKELAECKSESECTASALSNALEALKILSEQKADLESEMLLMSGNALDLLQYPDCWTEEIRAKFKAEWAKLLSGAGSLVFGDTAAEGGEVLKTPPMVVKSAPLGTFAYAQPQETNFRIAIASFLRNGKTGDRLTLEHD